MAFPSLDSVTDTDFATSVTSMAVNMPATVSAGDLLVALVHVRNSGSWTRPEGWMELDAQIGGAAVGELTIFYKIAHGTEGGGTQTWTASTGTTAAWQVLKISAWNNPSTFGNTTQEASTGQLSGNILGNVSTSGAAGNIESITAYLAPTGTRNVVFGLYNAGTDALMGTTQPVSFSSTGWITGTFATPVAVAAATSYYILANADGSFQCTIARAAETSAGRFVANAYDGTMPDPSGTGNNNFRYSIYATYQSPIESNTSSGDSSSADPPSLTASWGSDDNLWIAVAGHSAISATPFSAAPTNYTGFAQNGASSGGAATAVAHGERDNATATEDPGTFTVSGSNRFWAAATLAIQAAAGGGGGGGADPEWPIFTGSKFWGPRF